MLVLTFPLHRTARDDDVPAAPAGSASGYVPDASYGSDNDDAADAEAPASGGAAATAVVDAPAE